MIRALVLAASLILASSGCNLVEVVSQDPGRAARVSAVTILPFAGVDVKKFLTKPEGPDDTDAIEFNTKAEADYGAFPQRFSEEVAKGAGAKVAFADKEPASGYFVKGLWEKVTPGSTGMRVGSHFTPGGGAAMQELGKVEVRFTCWLKEVGKDKETPIATFSAVHENKGGWSGGYDAVWDLAEKLAGDLAERLAQVSPGLGAK